MSRKKKELPIFEEITITDIAAEGKSLARVNDMVVFVPWAVPGDVVDLQVRKKKHSYCEAEVIRYHKYSELRTQPFCQHFGVCGGCKWQQLPYSEQLAFKQKQVFDQLTRIGKIDLPEISPILGSAKTQEYRNKLEFGCCNKRWLTQAELKAQPSPLTPQPSTLNHQPSIGFHVTGFWDKVLPIEKCWLMNDLNNQIRNFVRDYAIGQQIPFFDAREQVGLLRNLMIRNNAKGEYMVVFQFCTKEMSDDYSDKLITSLLQAVADKFPQIISLQYVINNKCNDTIGDLDVMVFSGIDHILEEMEGLHFKVGPKSFYQTNTDQAYELYKVARDFAQLSGHELVYDLYTGTGTIANFVSRQAQQVIGIEYVPEAIEDAKVNSEINGIKNTLFYAGDMKDVLNDDFIAEHGRPDVIITDPPRAGMHPDVVDTILRAAPQRIIYVSCNPATQARDLQLLSVAYQVERIQPVDMFPHTTHVENVVSLNKR